MNPNQLARQIKHKLQTVRWPTGSADLVFGTRNVFVYAGAPTDDLQHPGFPCALVTVEDSTHDEDHPDLFEQSFGVILVTEVAGGSMGEFAVIGGARPNIGKSANAGLTEIAERARAAVEDLTGVDGARILLSASSTAGSQSLGRGRHIAFSQLNLVGLCTSAEYFAPPQQLARSGTAWSWEGAHCAARFDFVRYRLMWKSGSTPPATPADADGTAYTGTTPSTTHTAGTSRAYSIFADYSTRDPSVIEKSSAGDVVGAYLTT